MIGSFVRFILAKAPFICCFFIKCNLIFMVKWSRPVPLTVSKRVSVCVEKALVAGRGFKFHIRILLPLYNEWMAFYFIWHFSHNYNYNNNQNRIYPLKWYQNWMCDFIAVAAGCWAQYVCFLWRPLWREKYHFVVVVWVFLLIHVWVGP